MPLARHGSSAAAAAAAAAVATRRVGLFGQDISAGTKTGAEALNDEHLLGLSVALRLKSSGPSPCGWVAGRSPSRRVVFVPAAALVAAPPLASPSWALETGSAKFLP